MFISPPWLILDIATAALPDAADYLTPAILRKPPGNYSKPEAVGLKTVTGIMCGTTLYGLLIPCSIIPLVIRIVSWQMP